MRGEKYAYLTNQARFVEMERYLDAAEDALQKALDLNPKLEIAWIARIHLAKSQSKRVEMASYLEEAVENLPNHSRVYWHYFEAIAPKWGGSTKQRMALKIRILANYPNDPDYAWVDDAEEYDSAWELYWSGKYAAALEAFKALIAERDTAARR